MTLGSLAGTSLDGNCFSGSSLAGDTLGARVYELQALGGVSIDPVRAYGERSAAWIMSSLRQLPAEERRAALRELFDRVDPSLWATVDAQAAQFKAQGRTAPAALERAIAASMSTGILRELVQTGERVMRGDRTPVPRRSMLGLGVYPDDVHPLGGVWSSVKGAATTAGHWAADGAKKLGGFACDVLNDPAGQVAAVAAGGPAGGIGVAAAQGVCPKPKEPKDAAPSGKTYQAPAPKKTPAWLLPAGIVAGGLVLVLVLKRK